MTKISQRPVLTTAKGNAYIPVVDPDETDPALQNKRIKLSTLAAGADNNLFPPYNPGASYSKDKPDFVKYDGYVYEYINPVPEAGKTPASSPEYWRIVPADRFTNLNTGTPVSTVNWIEPPTVTLSGNDLTVSEGKLRNEAAIITVPGDTDTYPAVPAGQLQPYTVYADYSVLPAEFKAISNPAVGEDASYVFPAVPEGGLWVGYFVMRELGFTAEPANPVLSVSINGGTPQVPGATGHLNLQVLTPIAAGQYNPDHPAINTIDELAAYLLSGGTYTPPAVNPVTGASATPQSDTEILLTWTNPA